MDAVSEDEVGELVATAGPRTARRLRRNGVVVAPGAEAGGAQQPVGRLDYSASVLSSGLKFSLGTMHTVFFLDHQITQQLMQMPIAQESTFIFATIFAVHGLTHVAKLWILYLIIGLFVARMGSPGCASPATPRCHPRFSLASTRGLGRPPATLPTTPVVEGCAAGSMTYEAAFDAAQGWAAARPWIRGSGLSAHSVSVRSAPEMQTCA